MKQAVHLGLHREAFLSLMPCRPFLSPAPAYGIRPKTGLLLVAKAMGLSALPVRLAVMVWTLARTVDRILYR